MSDIAVKGYVVPAIVEILGGVIGISFSIWMMITQPMGISSTFLLEMSLLSLVAGVFLLKKERKGRILSFIVFGLQILEIKSSVFTFLITALPVTAVFTVSTGLPDPINMAFNVQFLRAAFNFQLVASDGLSIGINLFALLMFWLVDKHGED